jgi:hypothetical protein
MYKEAKGSKEEEQKAQPIREENLGHSLISMNDKENSSLKACFQ